MTDSPNESSSVAPIAIVVGAGIAGLTAAYRLQGAGFSVRVLEAEALVGGRMSSVEVQGFVMNRASTILPSGYQEIRHLASELGLGEQLTTFPCMTGTMRDGVVHRMRSDHSLSDFLRTKLVSWRSKLLLTKLVADGARIKSALDHEHIGPAAPFDTETALQYCDRRLNDEIKQYFIEPALRMLSPTASIVEFFSLTLNVLGGDFMAYPGGIGFLTEALAARLDVSTGAVVTSVECVGRGARVSWQCDGEEHVAEVDACVLAVPAPVAAKLHIGLEPSLARLLGSLQYCSVLIAHFGLSRRPDEPAMLVQLAASEDPSLCTVSFDHNIRPAMVPAGKGQIASYWTHAWSVERMSLTDDELLAQMLPSLERIIPNIRSIIEVTWIDRWRHAVLDSSPGFCSVIGQLVERLDPRAAVQLAGDYFSTSSTNIAALSGERAATHLIARAGLHRQDSGVQSPG